MYIYIYIRGLHGAHQDFCSQDKSPTSMVPLSSTPEPGLAGCKFAGESLGDSVGYRIGGLLPASVMGFRLCLGSTAPRVPIP